MSGKPVRTYRNSDVERVVGLVPEGHVHLRLIIEFRDQVIVLHEATVAAIVRAYVDVVTHPTRRAVELVRTSVERGAGKPGYARDQLIESGRSEEEVLREFSPLALPA